MTGNWEDDIFENRNKLYGSYYLRRKYNKYLLISFLLSVLLILTPILLLNYNNQKIELEADFPAIISVDLTHPMDVDDLLTEPRPPVKVTKPDKEDGVPVISDSTIEMKKPPIKSQEIKKDSIIADENVNKNKEGSNDSENDVNDTTSFIHVDKLPQFIGGNDEFIKFVRKNFIIPDEVIKKKIKGKIVIQVFISRTGDVIYVKLLTGTLPIVDNEALRVLSIPKKWMPAIRGGKAIPFKLNIPIRF